jgi:CubicO group peptidase (beta-lactamase class C family)
MKAVFVIALVSASVFTWGQEAPREPRLSNLNNDIAAHADVPGLAVAATKEGKIIYERGFGWADRERGLCATYAFRAEGKSQGRESVEEGSTWIRLI